MNQAQQPASGQEVIREVSLVLMDNKNITLISVADLKFGYQKEACKSFS